MAVYNHFHDIDPQTKQLQMACLDKAHTVMMALGVELDIDQ